MSLFGLIVVLELGLAYCLKAIQKMTDWHVCTKGYTNRIKGFAVALFKNGVMVVVEW